MSNPRVALPPGIYYITATNQNGFVVPKKSGAVLQFDDDSAKKTWKFTGNGTFICPDDSYYAYCSSPLADAPVLGGASSSSTWSVNVVDNGDGSFKGTIMASNDQTVYWAASNGTVVLKGNAMEFVFTPPS